MAHGEKGRLSTRKPDMRSVLFYRDFKGFSGGHLKVWDYFNHVADSGDHVARICFSEQSLWDQSNPWIKLRDRAPESWHDVRADILFLGGLDWRVMDERQGTRPPGPIVNLVQHVRHGWPTDPRFEFLKRKAIRICVGDEIGASIKETGQVNGPVFVIPNGINLEGHAHLRGIADKDIDVLIAAIKQRQLGSDLARSLAKPGRKVDLSDKSLLRADYLAKAARAKVTVFLPNRAEGLYLPPLEGMALGTLVVCPSVPGTEYCRAGYNCFRPEYEPEGLRAAVEAALALTVEDRRRMLGNAGDALARHDLAKERGAFLEILRNVDQIW